MKNYSVGLLIIGLHLTGCGQIGPLYLPTDKPPVFVPKEETETKDTDKKTPPPPLPKSTQPAKVQ